MATERQIAANRRNAQKSTGPRTPEGKARSSRNARKSTGPRAPKGKASSSRNALKHGIYARHLPLTPEDRASLHDTLAACRADLRPVGPLEQALVFQIAVAEWGRHRQACTETRVLGRSIHDLQQTGGPNPLLQVFTHNLSGLNYLGRIEARFNRVRFRALNDLLRIQKDRRRPKNQKITKRTEPNAPAKQAIFNPDPDGRLVPQDPEVVMLGDKKAEPDKELRDSR